MPEPQRPTEVGVLNPVDVAFTRIPVWWRTSAGTPYLRWISFGMPKLGQYADILKTTVFLYMTPDHAKSGTSSSGTGFLLAVPSEEHGESFRHVHCVTNRHVAVYNPTGPPAPVIRINRRSATPEVIELDPAEWISRPDWHDVAVSPPLDLSPDFDAVPLDHNWWMTEKEERAFDVGPLDDVVTVGRFVDCDGIETNLPAVRFGHISTMHANIKQEATGFLGRSIVIDAHCRAGFSGSPVFMFRTSGSHFLPTQPPETMLMGGGHLIRLLGILWGQFPEMWELKELREGKTPQRHNESLITDGKYVERMSGMSCVIPSAFIRELVLNDPTLCAMRLARENQHTEYVGSLRSAPKAE